MAIYQGDEKIVDRYVGETLVTRTYQGDKLIFDAYSELSGTLPLAVRSRASQVLKNYIIYGESVQDGTPTPDNPVEVTGLGVRTVNLLDKDLTNIINNRKLDSMGTEQFSNAYWCTTTYIPISPGTEYSVYDPNSGSDVFHAFYDVNKNFLMSFSATGQSLQTATSPATAAYIRCSLLSYTRYPDAFASAMLFEGSTAPTSYIPYGYNLPLKVTSNGTTTDYPIYIGDSQLMRIPDTEYADYVDYGKGKIVRYIKEYTFTGEEKFSSYGVGFFTSNGFSDATDTYAITTRFSHFTAKRNNTLGDMATAAFGDDCACFRATYKNVMLRSTANFTTVEECKAYFKAQYDNGTPVKMWYALATPVEEDPPVPFPDITLPRGEVTIDIEGELKPQATVKGRINPVTA